MSPAHHPSNVTLVAYACGNLAEGAALVVALHLTACQECRSKVEIAEAAGGILLDKLPPSELTANSFAETLSRLDAPPPPAELPQHMEEETWPPEPLRRYRIGRWRWIGPGMKQIIVVPKKQGGSSAHLLQIAPGTALPRHGHSGVELACVLRGSFSDQRGKFAAGDFSEATNALRHRPVAGAEGECICLIATSGPLRLYGLAGRIIQVLLGF